MRYIAPKGFIAIDGTSLTVVDVGDDWFNVTLIAYSQTKSFSPAKSPATASISKSILSPNISNGWWRLRAQQSAVSAITPKFLKTEHGFMKEGAR